MELLPLAPGQPDFDTPTSQVVAETSCGQPDLVRAAGSCHEPEFDTNGRQVRRDRHLVLQELTGLLLE